MSKSVRSFLENPDLETPVEVEVADFKQISPFLGVLSFTSVLNGSVQRFDDVFNINDSTVMETLLQDRAGKKTFAFLTPDTSADADGHPEIVRARIEE